VAGTLDLARGHEAPAKHARSVDSRHTRRVLIEIVGVAWVVGAAVAVLVPALAHGQFLGSYGWLSGFGLTQSKSVVWLHGNAGADQIDQMIPWSSLAWTQIHQGHLPLWNPYSALGTPLAFNWQSSAFSLPALVSYALPLRYGYDL
jgi:hypothetical protein